MHLCHMTLQTIMYGTEEKDVGRCKRFNDEAFDKCPVDNGRHNMSIGDLFPGYDGRGGMKLGHNDKSAKLLAKGEEGDKNERVVPHPQM